MANSEEKLSKFVQAITAYAEEQRANILREAEQYKIERMQQAEDEVLLEAYKLIQQETGDLRNERVRQLSRRDLEARQKVLARRLQIIDEVFAKAESKLMEYTKSAEYPEFLKNSLRQMIQLLPENGTVYAFAKQDEGLMTQLLPLCPPNSRFEVADNIKIGGIRAVNEKVGQIIDNTLDAKLASQREWFTVESGLTLN